MRALSLLDHASKRDLGNAASEAERGNPEAAQLEPIVRIEITEEEILDDLLYPANHRTAQSRSIG